MQQLHKSPRYADLLPLLGAKSLLLTEGEVWRAQRGERGARPACSGAARGRCLPHLLLVVAGAAPACRFVV